MKKYFTTNIENIYINGELRENVQVVRGIQTTTSTEGIPQYMEVPSEYMNCSLIGCAYLPNETPIFQQVDVEETEEETQLDKIEQSLLRIENENNQLLSDIKASTIDEYTLELMKEGII